MIGIDLCVTCGQLACWGVQGVDEVDGSAGDNFRS
jgi:hypothetical protein